MPHDERRSMQAPPKSSARRTHSRVCVASERAPSSRLGPGSDNAEESPRATPLGWGSTPLLKAEEEVRLSIRIEVGVLADEKLGSGRRHEARLARELARLVVDGERAKEHLIKANVRLVEHFARRFLGRGLDWDDLVQEGMFGLIRAVEGFDYTRGTKFSTYAATWIRQAMGRAVAQHGRTIRLPAHVHAHVERIRVMSEKLAGDLGREPADDELAGAAGVSLQRLRELRGIERPIWSLSMSWPNPDQDVDGWVVPESSRFVPLGDVVIELFWSEPTRPDNGNYDLLTAALATRPPRSREILNLRYGNPPWTLEQIGQRFGITRERARQIVAKELSHLADRLRLGVTGDKP
ncbi:MULTISPECIES: sigma-70 family RNA polymerase sigma factor [unclassified Knoellia]|uniref:sigma-70 family RNA polymerase sigma factor n=1 Tax=Knoellia altitudinis TaxID=3404795 RepID=UPI003615E80C